MKKISIFLAMALFLFSLGGGSAWAFTDTTAVNATLAEGPIAGIYHPSSVTYTHATPTDFEVPWDIVNSASLTINGYWINDNNDSVAVEGTIVGSLLSGGSQGSYFDFWSWSTVSWDTPSITTIDIAATFGTWAAGDPLSVTINANGGFWDGALNISTSRFDLDYENGTAPVPEPATMMLFGLGLLGLAGVSRKKS